MLTFRPSKEVACTEFPHDSLFWYMAAHNISQPQSRKGTCLDILQVFSEWRVCHGVVEMFRGHAQQATSPSPEMQIQQQNLQCYWKGQ